MRKRRKHYTPAAKVAILHRHLIEKAPVSDLCDQSHLQPTVFGAWQRQFFENGTGAFGRQGHSAEDEHLRTIAASREKLWRKAEAISERMEEHIRLKESLEEPGTGLGEAKDRTRGGTPPV